MVVSAASELSYVDGMRVQKTGIAAAGAALFVIGALSWSVPAQAADTFTISTEVGSTAAGDTYSSTYTITVDAAEAARAKVLMVGVQEAAAADSGQVDPEPYDDAFEALAADGDDGGGGSTPALFTAKQAASGTADLYCNTYYGISDFNGTFSYQHRCGGTTAPWGYKLSTAVRSIIVGNISERGMRWSLNGTAKQTSTGHNVVPYYQLHGTWKPVRDGDTVGYNDVISFRCNIGSNCKGSVTIRGAIRNVRP